MLRRLLRIVSHRSWHGHKLRYKRRHIYFMHINMSIFAFTDLSELAMFATIVTNTCPIIGLLGAVADWQDTIT